MNAPRPDPAEVEALLALIRHRYGDRLDAAQLEALRKDVEAIVAQAAALRAIRLANADEPLQRFAAFRADE